ncbi:hypothetical protein KPL78_12275 [Roseomonas sp. HJA6]|uniref:Two pore domain potassium channel family protein n=1 Tax=Roseomonas alba TaxID=2846776 RepID=A0ABS7A8L7_9PROT|nr:hypothetical protein [Neoroseomonas alba]MBW6398632.1 hypothetical protein [Neoroseomonas alba]
MAAARAAAEITSWGPAWLIGGPLIMLTVVLHVLGLGATRAAHRFAMGRRAHLIRNQVLNFAVIMSLITFMVTLLHILQAAIWATTYILVGAATTGHQAMLYSLSAITSYGHAEVFLDARWQMLGAIEALNGVILIGLSTAFLFAMIQQSWQNHPR